MIMKKYCKKPIVIEAQQWFKLYDHSAVMGYPITKQQTEDCCAVCGKQLGAHGIIMTLEGNHIVCPGDWIIKGIEGEFYPCKPQIFKKTYVEDKS